jgi:GNAT superfamily N-acetyltransferase
MSFLIRPFSEKDTEETDVVLRAAYRTSFGRKDNLRRYLEIPDSYALVAVENDHVAGFGGIIDYGPFSYIGLMAADPILQRRGIGKSILDGLLTWAYARKCPTILLSASAAGVHMYEKNGFIHQDRTDLLLRKKAQLPEAKPDTSQDFCLQEKEFPDLISFDKPHFGAERGSLLRSYYRDDPSRFLVSRDKEGQIDGYLVAQERTLGPWVVTDSEAAKPLLSRALQFPYVDPPTVFVSGQNQQCLDLLERYGFELQRSLSYMYLGKEIQRARATAIFGEATLGFG